MSLAYSKLSIADFCTRYNVVDGCGITFQCTVPNMPAYVLENAGGTAQPNIDRQYPNTLFLSPRFKTFAPKTPDTNDRLKTVGTDKDDAVARPITAKYTDDTLVPGYTPADTATQKSINATGVLYMQIARDEDSEFLLLRGPGGEYLHMLPNNSINSTFPRDTFPVLAWRQSSSALYTAHWNILAVNNGNLIILQNRASGQCAFIDNSVVANYALLNSGSNYYTQGICRVIGISITDALNNISNTGFTVQRWNSEDQRANYIDNPIGPLALSNAIVSPNAAADANGKTRASYINLFCASGLNGFGDGCIVWATKQNDSASGWVPLICNKYPNDSTLCACLNIKRFYGVIQYISVATNYQTSWLAYCNSAQCANQAAAWRPSSTAGVVCQSNTCIQAINVGTANNVLIENVSLACKNSISLPQMTPVTTAISTLLLYILLFCAFFLLFKFIKRSRRRRRHHH